MKASTRKRAVSVFAATAMMVGAAVTIGAGTASAAVPDNVRFVDTGLQSDGSRHIAVYQDGAFAGAAYWYADGDKLQAVDPRKDGFGIAAYLGTSPIREASTYGHSSPYTATKTGDLPENRTYTYWVCIGGSSGQVCSDVYSAKS
ncbi:hypothetical protein [Streptomyces sp. NPDC046909]|uniref:hypothetical protein n=1 Tax=Streptomyces sp. NPDC046909 TaxID=3155617 RepID=UPI0033F9A77C